MTNNQATSKTNTTKLVKLDTKPWTVALKTVDQIATNAMGELMEETTGFKGEQRSLCK